MSQSLVNDRFNGVFDDFSPRRTRHFLTFNVTAFRFLSAQGTASITVWETKAAQLTHNNSDQSRRKKRNARRSEETRIKKVNALCLVTYSRNRLRSSVKRALIHKSWGVAKKYSARSFKIFYRQLLKIALGNHFNYYWQARVEFLKCLDCFHIN